MIEFLEQLQAINAILDHLQFHSKYRNPRQHTFGKEKESERRKEKKEKASEKLKEKEQKKNKNGLYWNKKTHKTTQKTKTRNLVPVLLEFPWHTIAPAKLGDYVAPSTPPLTTPRCA